MTPSVNSAADPTARALKLPGGETVILIDTVGLVRRLPHQLVEAFKSTLEEAASADLLWNVCDISSGEVDEQISVTRKLMEELGVGHLPMLTVLNKCDQVGETPLPINGHTAVISAKTGFGLEELLEKTAKLLAPTHRRLRLCIPYAQSGLINEILREGKLFSQEYVPEGTLVDALVDVKLLYKVADYQVSENH